MQLYMLKKKRNKIKNVGDSIDDRQHGLIRIATRYSIIWYTFIIDIISWFFIILLIISLIAQNNILSIWTRTMNAFIPLIIRKLMLLTAINLSFSFSKKKYDKQCGYCHNKMRIYCHRKAQKGKDKIFKEYELKQVLLEHDYQDIK